MKTKALLLIAFAVLGFACGSPSTDVGSGGNPEEPVSNEPGDPQPSPSGRVIDGAQVVEPRSGMADLRTVPFDKAVDAGDGSKLRVFFWSGVEPCNVLDHVDVEESDDTVTITLYEGHDPQAGDVACIELAAKKVVIIDLDAPLGDRTVEDGA